MLLCLNSQLYILGVKQLFSDNFKFLYYKQVVTTVTKCPLIFRVSANHGKLIYTELTF